MADVASHRHHGRVLVVDASPASLDLLATVLQGAGYSVLTVADGRAALRVALEALPGLVLLDMQLPDLDGLAVCAALKADPRTATVPVIFLSAQHTPQLTLRAFAAGGVDYVTRPVHPDEILARVRMHLSLRELHLQLQVANGALAERLGDLERSNARLQEEIAARRVAEELSRRLLDQERRRVERLYALRAAMTAIGNALDLPHVQLAVVAQAVALLSATRGALALASRQGRLHLTAVHGLPQALIGRELAPNESLLGLAVAGGATVSSPTGAPLPGDAIFGPGAALAAPLRVHDTLVGVVLVAGPREGGAFDHEAGQLLDLFAQQAAAAVQNAQLFAELGQLARSDPLTGLHNRRHFFEIAGRELERVRRNEGQLAVLLLDLDYFKAINDRFGHQAGDHALRAVADLLRATLRAADVPARFGGEELVVLLPDTDKLSATLAAERLCQAIGALALETERGPLRLTVSIGVAALEGSPHGEQIERLLARADRAMYAAKAAGRNRVSCWHPIEAQAEAERAALPSAP